jgi:hypothetical protein
MTKVNETDAEEIPKVFESELDNADLQETELKYSDDRSWMDDEIQALEEGFSHYMHVRQTLNHLSQRTLRRYLPLPFGRKNAYNKVEREFSHRMTAAHYTYHRQSLLSAKVGADFAAALMAVSATECLLLASFLELRPLVMLTPEYKRITRKKVKQDKKGESKKRWLSFQQFMSSLQIAEQYKIALQLDLVRDEDTEGRVSEVLESYKLRGAAGLLRFVKDSRNQLHTGKLVASIDSYSLTFDVLYSKEAMALFHMNFALCAYQMMGAVKNNVDKIKAELALAEGRIKDGDEAED